MTRLSRNDNNDFLSAYFPKRRSLQVLTNRDSFAIALTSLQTNDCLHFRHISLCLSLLTVSVIISLYLFTVIASTYHLVIRLFNN